MATAIIGTGHIGKAVATHLAAGGETVVLASNTPANAEQLARDLGSRASAASVADAIEQADTVIFAVWLDSIKELVVNNADRLPGKVVIDPSNPIAVGGDGQYSRTLPDGVSSASVIASLLPPATLLVKAFGTIGADSLAGSANRTPDRVALFYAADESRAESVAERLISIAGFEPVKAGGLDQAIRIEMFGDLHQFGGLDGKLLTAAEAKEALEAGVSA